MFSITVVQTETFHNSIFAVLFFVLFPRMGTGKRPQKHESQVTNIVQREIENKPNKISPLPTSSIIL